MGLPVPRSLYASHCPDSATLAGPLSRRQTLGALLFASLMPPIAARAETGLPLSGYIYEDTRRLVSLVEAAATLIEQEGRPAFGLGISNLSRWPADDFYLFAYTLDGVCVFHQAEPILVGRNLIEVRDVLGKPVVQHITSIGARPEPQAADWVFYQWESGQQLSPAWKGPYVRKAVAPDGTVMVIGSGGYNLKIERQVVRRNVLRAVAAIEARGETVFAELVSPAFPYRMPDGYLFVMDMTGRTIVDPAYPGLGGGRDMSLFRDAVGVPVVATVLERLAHQDEVWMQFLMPRPGDKTPARKALFARKVGMNGRTLVVGADFFLPTPIWMRV